ncbi:hypothetical protein [Virgibacillus phasianinus]|nr:hypothetical protein [Virgibacillus phasianinus]
MKKNPELPTFTILNPEFHAPEQVSMDVEETEISAEESPENENN